MTRAVPRLVQPSSGSWVILTLPVPMHLPPSCSNQRGVGNAKRSTPLPLRMFSSTGPSLTTVGGILCESLGSLAPLRDESHRAEILWHSQAQTEPFGRPQ